MNGRVRAWNVRRQDQSGFALTLVFLLAALIAIALYRELPRVAFESQRDREDLLIARGEEYRRAIQLFVRENNRYPQTLDDLEKFNNKRYLRRRYKDPMTGKDEWRVINVGPNGMFTNSLVQNKPEGAAKVGTTVEEMASGQTGSEEQRAKPTVLGRVRASDMRIPQDPTAQQPAGEEAAENQPPQQPPQPPQGDQNAQNAAQQPGAPAGATTNAPPFPWQQQGQSAAQPGQVPGQQPAGAPPFPWQRQGQTAGQPGQPIAQSGEAAGQAQAGQQQPLLPGQPGWRPGAIGTGQSIQPAPQTAPPGSEPPGTVRYQGSGPGSGYGYGGVNPGAMTSSGTGSSLQPVPAAVGDALRRQSQSPPILSSGGRQGGMNFGGGGIAGVASKSEDEGIKLYNERSKYKEWEFVYDRRKDTTSPMGAQMGGMQSGLGGSNTSGSRSGSSTGTGGGTSGGGTGGGGNSLFTPTSPRK